MLGAVFGDIVGSVYRAEENHIKTTDFPLLDKWSTFTDVTVMTAAVAGGLMESYGQDDDAVRLKTAEKMREFGRKHPERGYGGRFAQWLNSEESRPYDSCDDNSVMRAAPAGWLYPSLSQTLRAAELTAETSNNHPESIKGARAAAAAVYLARIYTPKAMILKYMSDTFGYDLTVPVSEIMESSYPDGTCRQTMITALTAFRDGHSYEEVIRLAVSLGGDSSVTASIAGGIAEAYYGMPEYLMKAALASLTNDLQETVREFTAFREKPETVSHEDWHDLIKGDPADDLTLDEALMIYYTSGQSEDSGDQVMEVLLRDMRNSGTVLVPAQQLPDGEIRLPRLRSPRGEKMQPCFTVSEEADKARVSFTVSYKLSELMASFMNRDDVDFIGINPFGYGILLNKTIVSALLQRYEEYEKQTED